ncbi:MATE family efflux transporter [Paenibacillus gansuensis]|uniref:MATE family efflux transporter n=1 Tax=Paenibacillus gansuensis TaxID=306542 RepID=A0ABW5P9N7_9BACL
MERSEPKPSQQVSFNLFQLTWPIFLEIVLFMLMGTADTLMISGVSDDAVSAVGIVNQYMFICILIMEVISNGASIVVAQYIGSKRYQEATKIVAVSITMNLVLGLTVSGGILLFGNELLNSMNLEGQVLAYAKTYMQTVGGFIFIQALINVFSSMIRTFGFTKQSMYISLGMNVLHITLNYILIFGKMGFPELGVSGAAISTVISRSIALLVFIWMLYRIMEVRMVIKDYVTLSKEYMGKILKVGIPSALEQVTYHCCQIVFIYYVTYLGAEALASRQYAMAVSQYIYLFGAAIGMGTSIIAGRLIGAGLKDEAYKRVLTSVKWSLLLTVLVDLAVILFRYPLVSLFTDNGEIIRMTAQILVLSIVLETGRSLNLVLVNSLRAAADAKFTVYIGFLTMVGISVPLGYLFVFHWDMGLPGVWLAIASDEWLRGIIMWFRWKSKVWQRQSLVEPAPVSHGMEA